MDRNVKQEYVFTHFKNYLDKRLMQTSLEKNFRDQLTIGNLIYHMILSIFSSFKITHVNKLWIKGYVLVLSEEKCIFLL